ncbi:Nif3-like dinuclear metal center hexameric protein [Desulfococcaceae bacterium OttesenSCG-928-F15]|nr:Nif3-like dinuclear metal center hexameric protein [Desulfococcaceae bacterium OttesenSCG-928-F15]
MSFLVRDAMAMMEEIAPRSYAESWDPTGLQIGNPLAPVQRIAFALDATVEIVREAIEKGANLLIVHHPLFFKPLKNLDLSSPEGRLVEEAIRAGLSIYAAHTNLDSAPGGLNDALCRKIGLENLKVLAAEKEEDLYLLHMEIPDHVRESLDAAAPSMACTFSWWASLGKESVMGSAFVEGRKRFEVEKKIRALCLPMDLQWTRAGSKPTGAGLGRIGKLAEPLSLRDLALKIKKALKTDHIRMVGDEEKKIQTLAVCSGSGASLIPAALAGKADCLLTGDLKYHEAMSALDYGLALLDAGHFGTEHLVVELLQKSFEERLRERDGQGIGFVTLEGRDPFRII